LDNQEKIIKQLEQEIRSLKKDSSTSSKPPSTDNNKPKKNQSLREKTAHTQNSRRLVCYSLNNFK
ncbi:MAG: hypothetical protein NT091_01315, partial [Candidatus Falkowbacteria bacterium]|nr:hypothetical protein [Candidatus Falkowbacteria bacterium]